MEAGRDRTRRDKAGPRLRKWRSNRGPWPVNAARFRHYPALIPVFRSPRGGKTGGIEAESRWIPGSLT